MKKLSALNLGKGLKREELKNIKGGFIPARFDCYCEDGSHAGSVSTHAECRRLC